VAFAEACRCHDALLALGRTGAVGGADELGFLGLLLGGSQDLRGFVTRVLGPIIAYDQRRGTELVATLRAWFACGGHLGPTGQALHIHVNTVGQRLERITRLLGPEWAQPEQALEVHLALRVHQALGDAG
jgi:DNA-binding PucR family transcriptional regulator